MILSDIVIRIARAGLHHYEEPPLSGEKGSGTVFFSGCDMKCAFCQNYEISHGGKGVNADGETLIKLMRHLVREGAHNINLVTPSPWIKRLIPILKEAKKTVEVPFVWNSSGYEAAEDLRELEGIIDIYLPDFKYGDDALAARYSRAEGYFERAYAAISEMRRQQPKDVFADGLVRRGVIVRHLVLPGALESTRRVLSAIAEIDRSMYVSLMGQYFPTAGSARYPEINRRLTDEEYALAEEYFFDAGLTRGFAQSLDSAAEEYVPSFDTDALRELIRKSE